MRVFRGLPVCPLPGTALTIGNFDGLHLGHRALIARVQEISVQQRLTPTVLTFEPHPREFFAPQTVPARLSTLREKLEMLADCGVMQVLVVPFNRQFASLTADAFMQKVLLEKLGCAYLAVGDDFRFGARRAGDFSLLTDYLVPKGVMVEAVPEISLNGCRTTSSAIRLALESGDMAQATRLLGRPYTMAGRVMAGQRLGRTWGFPTANIYIRHSPLPLDGVFAVRVAGIGDEAINGVANLGIRPTVGGVRTLLEIHLFDFSGDLYGKHLRVSFLKKLRNERKFPNFDELRAQIARDAEDARRFFAALQ